MEFVTTTHLGFYVDYIDSLTEVMLSAIDMGSYGVLFQLGNNRNQTRKRIVLDDLMSCSQLLVRFPLTIFSIIPSRYNLCGDSKYLAWNGNELQDAKTIHIVREIEYELSALAEIQGRTIVELGSYRDKNAGIRATIGSLNHISFKPSYGLVLTNSLDQYHNIGVTLDDLYSVYDLLDKDIKPYTTICIHIAYLFVNGLYDIRNKQDIDRFFNDYTAIFDKVKMVSILLTDTTTSWQSKEYIEVPIGQGVIWNDSDIIYTWLDMCKEKDIMVLTKYVQDIDVILNL